MRSRLVNALIALWVAGVVMLAAVEIQVLGLFGL